MKTVENKFVSAARKRAVPASGAEPARTRSTIAKAAIDTGPDIAAMVESIIGCKWSLHVLAQVRAGVNRPGVLARSAKGLTTKVLNERLAKMLRYGILSRRAYAEVPPRVEYALTAFGERFTEVLDAVERLKRDAASDGVASAGPKKHP